MMERMFPSALAREVWCLHMNIRDLNYVIKNNKKAVDSFKEW
jgi:hypothetical protein